MGGIGGVPALIIYFIPFLCNHEVKNRPLVYNTAENKEEQTEWSLLRRSAVRKHLPAI